MPTCCMTDRHMAKQRARREQAYALGTASRLQTRLITLTGLLSRPGPTIRTSGAVGRLEKTQRKQTKARITSDMSTRDIGTVEVLYPLTRMIQHHAHPGGTSNTPAYWIKG